MKFKNWINKNIQEPTIQEPDKSSVQMITADSVQIKYKFFKVDILMTLTINTLHDPNTKHVRYSDFTRTGWSKN